MRENIQMILFCKIGEKRWGNEFGGKGSVWEGAREVYHDRVNKYQRLGLRVGVFLLPLENSRG
jgi:hypothetical protein